ncbi:MAG: aspartyl protease family protein [Bacteroidota bacterium]
MPFKKHLTRKSVLALSIALISVALLSFLMKGKEAYFMRTIPIETQSNLMFTTVTIKGKDYRFLIDTGAPFTLSKELAKEIDFKVRRVSNMGSVNSQRGKAYWGKLKKLEIGELTFSNVNTAVIDYNKVTLLKCFDFDGIIGSNLMGAAAWQIDHDAKVIRITNRVDSLPDIGKSQVLPMKKLSSIKKPGIQVKVNKGNTAFVLFDTGSGDFFDLPYASLLKSEREGVLDSRIKYVTARGLGNVGAFGAEDTTGYMVKVPEFSVGKEKMENVVFDMSHDDKAKLGVQYLKGRVVTFDFPGNRIFVAQKAKPHVPHDFSTFGFSIFPHQNKITARPIYEGSMAQAAGLEIGDQIVSINGKEFQPDDLCNSLWSLVKALNKSDEASLKVIKSDGNQATVTVSKSYLLK